MSSLLIVALLSGDVVRACVPPPAMCEQLADECLLAGISSGHCEISAEGICPGSRCMACERTLLDCEVAGGDCSDLAGFCDAALEGCSCAPRCKPAAELTLAQLFAVCFAYPWALGDDCKKPSAGQCFAILTLRRDLCDVTTCEYMECMEDLAAQGACGPAPASCKKLHACELNEEDG